MSSKFGVKFGFLRISYFGVKQGHLRSFLAIYNFIYNFIIKFFIIYNFISNQLPPPNYYTNSLLLFNNRPMPLLVLCFGDILQSVTALVQSHLQLFSARFGFANSGRHFCVALLNFACLHSDFSHDFVFGSRLLQLLLFEFFFGFF